MALRLFQDRHGREWRVWFVMPAGSAGMLGEAFREGWLCFERTDGGDRRRLAATAAPDAWDALSDERLELLCGVAEPARRSSASNAVTELDQALLETKQRGDTSSGNSAGREDERLA